MVSGVQLSAQPAEIEIAVIALDLIAPGSFLNRSVALRAVLDFIVLHCLSEPLIHSLEARYF